MATLAQMITRIADRLLDPNHTAITEVQIREAVNEAIDFHKQETFWFNEFEETVTLTADSKVLSLTTNTPLEIYEEGGVVIDYGSLYWNVRKVSTQKYDSESTQATGLPYMWTYRNDAFELYFIPDQAYSCIVRGIKDYTAFDETGTDDATSNDFTTEGERLIRYHALKSLAADYRQDLEMATTFENREIAELEKLREKTANRVKTDTNSINSTLL